MKNPDENPEKTNEGVYVEDEGVFHLCVCSLTFSMNFMMLVRARNVASNMQSLYCLTFKIRVGQLCS